jgi:hypothetical protein
VGKKEWQMKKLYELVQNLEKIDVFVDFVDDTFCVRIPVDDKEKIPDLIAGLSKNDRNNIIISKEAQLKMKETEAVLRQSRRSGK